MVDVVLDRVRKHALVHELADCCLHLALLRSELEIHGPSVRGRLLDSDALRAEAGVRPVRRDRAARSTGRRSRVVRRLAKIALASTLVLVLLALAAGLVFAGSASHIAAGVEIAGVNVGGLTADEAQARLEAVAARYESVPVAFTAGGATFPLRPSDVEARANWAAAAEEALERGDGPVPLRGLERLWLRTTGADVEPSVEVYEPALAYRLEPDRRRGRRARPRGSARPQRARAGGRARPGRPQARPGGLGRHRPRRSRRIRACGDAAPRRRRPAGCDPAGDGGDSRSDAHRALGAGQADVQRGCRERAPAADGAAARPAFGRPDSSSASTRRLPPGASATSRVAWRGRRATPTSPSTPPDA